jgi:hypothetical protein
MPDHLKDEPLAESKHRTVVPICIWGEFPMSLARIDLIRDGWINFKGRRQSFAVGLHPMARDRSTA